MSGVPTTLKDWFKPAWVADDSTVHFSHFTQTLWIACLFVVGRAILEQTVLRVLRNALAKQGKGDRAEAVFDNFYIVAWSVVTEVLAVYITLNINGGCTPWATDACLAGWPNHHIDLLQKWYMILMFQYYAHEMLGLPFGQAKLKTDMVVHHIATMGLISTAYSLNLNRYGIMWQALFDTSNPLLHAAKGLHNASLPQFETIKWVFFNLFALAFFVCRVAAAPYSILWPAVSRSLSVLPKEWALFLMGLMAIVCGMQWVWFYRIVQMATGKADAETEKADSKKKA